MARIISQINPDTGRRTKVGAVEGDTYAERTKNVASTFGVTNKKALRMSNADIAGPINSDNLKPASAITLPPAKTPTEAVGLSGALSTQADQFTTDLAEKQSKAEETKNKSFGDLESILSSVQGETALTDKAYSQDGGVDTLEAELKDINQQMLQEQESLRKQVERIQTAPGTATSGERNREVQEVERTSLRRQADMAIIQLARQGKYDSAKAIADRAVALELEQQKQKLDTARFIYEENKEQFTKAEQRLFETMQGDREREFANTEYRLRAEFEQKIKQNDPLYQAQLKKVRSEIDAGNVTITNPQAGKYAGALSIILGSGKFTKDQQASLIASVNSGEDPFTVIKNQAKTLLGQTGDTKLTNYEVAKSQLTRVQDSLNSYYRAGGSTSLLGGSYEDVINKLGNVNDPELVEIATEIASSLQIYRNAVSGTAYSVQEGQDIAKIFPGINKSEGLNNAILQGRMRAFDSTIDESYRTVLGSTYDSLKAIEQAGVKGTETDAAFVERILTGIGASYDETVAKVPTGFKAVIDNKTGQVGYIPISEFNQSLYTPI